jgi:hypothetical protein
MPSGRDPADHELGREAAKPGYDRAARHTMKGARFMTNDERQAMVRDEPQPLAAYFENLKARLDAYSKRKLDEMDRYQNRKAV